MGRWTDLAEWRGSTINEGDGDGRPGEAADRAVECRGVVIHIADGYYEGTISWQKNPAADVSSHFVIAGPRDVPKGRPDGRIAQVVDTDVRAWTQQAGNGHWISVECSGFSGDALSPAQIEGAARILAQVHQVYGVPLQLAISPAGQGLGHHSMGTNGTRPVRVVPTDTWTGPTWGHEQCPGPAIVAQKAAILARAIEIVNGATTQTEDDVPEFISVDGNYRGTIPGVAQWPLYSDRHLDLALAAAGKTRADVDKVLGADAPAFGVNLGQVTDALTRLVAALTKPVPVTVDADAVAGSLAANPTFLAALAKAVNDDAYRRMQS